MAMSTKIKRMLRSFDPTRGLVDWIDGVEAGTDLNDGVITTAKLADGALSADAVGRAKFAAGFFDGVTALAMFVAGFFTATDDARNKFAANFWCGATALGKFADQLWPEAKLAYDVLLTRAQIAMDLTSPPTALAGKGVVLGVGAECLVEPLAVPGMAVRIQLGGTTISHRGRKSTVAAVANLAVDIADGVNPRWDLVYSTDADPGVVTYVAGAAAGAPADPVLPAGAVPLARIVVPAMAGSINLGAAGTGWCEDLRQRQAAHLPMPAQSVGLPGGSTDISAAGGNVNLNVNVGGAGPINLLIVNPAAFSIGGAAAVALNTADLIVAALNQLAAQAAQACVFSYDTTSLRYYCTTRLLGGAATVAITAGAGNDLAVLLLLGTAAGGEEHVGTDRLSTALVRAAANVEPRSVDTVALADSAVTTAKVTDENVTPRKLSDAVYTPLYGSGADGALVVAAGITTLTQDRYYTNITIEAGGTLECDGCVPHATGTLDIAAGGFFVSIPAANLAGGDGGNGAGGAGGAAGAAGDHAYASANPTLAAAVAGSLGGAGGAAAAAGNNGAAGTAAIGMGGGGPAGGAGGAGDGGIAGAAGALAAVAPAPTHVVVPRLTYGAAGNSTQGGASAGGGGGGAGGAGGTGGGGGGGGSGAGGPPAVAFARHIVNAGSILSAGGNGGNGGDGEASGNTGAGGGGSGGGGGLVYLVCEDLVNTGTIAAPGGAAGVHGTPNGTGGTGDDGTAGTAGVVVTIQLGTGTVTVA